MASRRGFDLFGWRTPRTVSLSVLSFAVSVLLQVAPPGLADAASLKGIRFGKHEGFSRVVFDLRGEGPLNVIGFDGDAVWLELHGVSLEGIPAGCAKIRESERVLRRGPAESYSVGRCNGSAESGLDIAEAELWQPFAGSSSLHIRLRVKGGVTGNLAYDHSRCYGLQGHPCDDRSWHGVFERRVFDLKIGSGSRGGEKKWVSLARHPVRETSQEMSWRKAEVPARSAAEASSVAPRAQNLVFREDSSKPMPSQPPSNVNLANATKGLPGPRLGESHPAPLGGRMAQPAPVATPTFLGGPQQDQLLAQAAGASSAPPASSGNDQKLLQQQVKELEARFSGGNWGVGLGGVIDTGGRSRIEEAELDPNGIVRIKKDRNVRIGPIVESHFLFPTPWLPKSLKQNWVTGLGPFVAVRLGDDIVNGLGGGLMIGAGKKISDNNWLYFNIGVGLMVETGVRVLAGGIKENQPLPPGENSVRFRETDQWGLVILFSFRPF